MAEFRMPSLGADMDSGVLLEWLVHPGDKVTRGEIVAVVDTAKAAVEVETFETGVIERLLVEPGTSVPVGAPLAVIATATETGEAAMPALPEAMPTAVEPAPVSTSPLVRRTATEQHVDLATVHGTGFGGRITRADVERAAEHAALPVPTPVRSRKRVRVSPLARRLATELHVDLAAVAGTGPGGAIDADDVRRAAAPSPAPRERAPDGTGGHDEAAQRAAAMRATIATLMARSKREIPHYYLAETVDLGPATRWLRDRNRQLPVSERILPAALLLTAAARAAAAVPELNGFWIDDHFVPGTGVHLGVAVSLRGGGLVAPAIHDADQRDVTELMAALRDLALRTRVGKLRRAELSDPTITVSNLGEQGVESFHGVIYPPQVALVGLGRIAERAWAVDGLLGVRPTVTVSLAGDHRATDGATGARYLTTVARLLQRPEEL